MQGWTEGYVDGIDYIHAFYDEMSPALISFALLLRGWRPPASLTGFFRYAELGAGHAGTSTLLAAVHPDASFEAVEFNPSHIAGARRVAEDAGLANITLSEDSFADHAAHATENYDYVALHGVWSWVNAENRAILVDLLRRRLRPGGVVFLSYNALPGTLAFMPLRQLLSDRTAAGTGPLSGRIDKAIAFASRVAAQRSSHLAQTDGVIERLESLKQKSPNYIAHEYLNTDWTAFYAGDVARDLAAAKLSFAGPATPLDHIDELNLPAESLSLLAEAPDPGQRETLRDILMNRSFRRDLFVKGAERLSPAEQRQRLGATRFVLLVPPDDLPDMVTVPMGRLVLPHDLYGPLSEALGEGPQTLDGLLARPDLAGHAYEAVLRAVILLTGLAFLAPTLPDDGYEARKAAADRFNAAILERSRFGEERRHLASPLIGSGITLARLEQLFLLARRIGADPAAFAWDHMAADIMAGGLSLACDGRQLITAEDNIAELRARYAAFTRRRLPILERLGIA